MKIRLHEIAHCRAGDKDDTSIRSLFSLDERHYPLLCREVTAEAVRRHLSRTVRAEAVRFRCPTSRRFSSSAVRRSAVGSRPPRRLMPANDLALWFLAINLNVIRMRNDRPGPDWSGTGASGGWSCRLELGRLR
ncbi:AtuA-related protein [Skermanella pratensis]|uniref:AtuA-related protein n=1 Tax=Skermanella pratensis TaxID=2233999 RepID=UPI003CCD095A